MKQLRKLFVLALAFTLILGLLPISAGATDTPAFTDVPISHWAYSDIQEMTELGIFKGKGEGRFAPADSITVAEFLAMVGRAMYASEVTETSTWWEAYYSAAVAKGLISVSEYAAIPTVMNKAISRYEMARIMVRVDEKVIGNKAVTADTSKITDHASIPADFSTFVEQAYAKGLLTGDTSGNFNGNNKLLREQGAAVIRRLVDAKVVGEAEKQDEKQDEEQYIEDLESIARGEKVRVTIAGFIFLEDYIDGERVLTAPAGIFVELLDAPQGGNVLGTAYTTAIDPSTLYDIETLNFTITAAVDESVFDEWDVFRRATLYLRCTYVSEDGTEYTNVHPESGNASFITFGNGGSYDLTDQPVSKYLTPKK